jgi:hypothetical protein
VTNVLVAAGQTDHPPGQCHGLGWGCTISGGDLAAFWAMILVPPALLVLAVGHAVIVGVQVLRRRAGSVPP